MGSALVAAVAQHEVGFISAVAASPAEHLLHVGSPQSGFLMSISSRGFGNG